MLVHRVKIEIFFDIQFSTKHKLNVQLHYRLHTASQQWKNLLHNVV